MGKGDTLLNAAIGAVVTVVFTFTGASPILGGGVAGYLQQESRESGAKVGALSGVLAFLPFLLFLLLFFSVFLGGALAVGLGTPGGLGVTLLFFFVGPLFLLWSVSLGAIGGYLGTYIREDLEGSVP
jgi:hypothetical protein